MVTFTVTDLLPSQRESGSNPDTLRYSVPNVLFRQLSDRELLFPQTFDIPLTGAVGARDLLAPSIFGDDPDRVPTNEDIAFAFANSTNFTYLDRDVVREDDVFELKLSLFTVGDKNETELTYTTHFEGSGFEFGDDPLGPVLPIDGTIETIVLTQDLDEENGRLFPGTPLNLELEISGLDMDVSSTTFEDTDGFVAQILRGDQTMDISPYQITSFAGDGRDVTTGASRGGNDFIRLTTVSNDAAILDAPFNFAGDFMEVASGASLRGGRDTFVGTFPGQFNTAGNLGFGAVSGDVILAAGQLTGGNDILNFSDSTVDAAGVFGDASTATGTVTGGKDEITGSDFADVLVGDVGVAEAGSVVEAGNDTIFGLDGDDQIFGDVQTVENGATVTGGNDRLFGGDGNDRIEGGGGNDDLQGGFGRDVMLGEAGDDFLIIEDAGEVTRDEIYFGGAGTDHFILFSSATVDLRNVNIIGMEGVRFGGETGGGLRINSSQIQRGVFDPDGVVRVFAPDGQIEQFIIDVDDRDADLSDLLFRSWERGADEVIINGSTEDDRLTGSKQNDLINGGRGDDTLDGGAGRNTLTGGLGNDVYHLGLRDTVLEEAGQGFDQIISSRNFRGSMANVEQVTLADVGSARVIRGEGGDNRIDGNSFDNRLFGRGGDDLIDGVGGSNLLSGGAGEDTLNGGDGENTLVGGSGNDVINGGGADDVIRAGGGADSVLGGGRDDLIAAGAGDDSLDGGAGKDRLNGGNGNDRLFGGDGSDTLIGGFGADSFVLVVPNNGEIDEIVDFRNADTILLADRDFGLTRGVLDEDAFAFSPGALQTADTRIIYDGVTGRLLFDSDGNGSEDAILLAQLEVGLNIGADDFLVTF